MTQVQGSTRLTQQEHRILQMFWEGQSFKEIARALDISINTVEAHRYNIFKKLNTHNLIQTCRRGIQLGYLEVEYEINAS